MARSGKHSAELQTGFQVGAGDLEGLVFISGPCSALPNHCSRRRIPNGVVYRPEVEVRDGSERLYSKYNLALFEVLDKEPSGALLGVEEHDEGPAAAVLRRRRRRQQQSNEGSSEQRVARTAASKREAADEVEDTSDEHYRKLHRKPEYMERRIRNREIELYQYAQWQEGQRMGSERWRQLNGSHQHLAAHLQLGHVGGGSEAGGSDATGATQPQSRCASPMLPSAKPNNGSRVTADAGATKVEEGDLGDGTALINETLRRLDDMQTSDTTRKRFKSGMRNELKALLDSSGYQDARARSAANNTEDNTGSGNDASRTVAKESPSPPPQVVTSASNAVSNTSIVSTDLIAAGGDTVQQQQAPLSESERRVAHLGGTILEQLLIQAARLPPLADEEASDDSEESEGDASDKASDEENEVSEEASDEDGESQSNNSSSDSDDSQEGDADNASEAPEAEDEEDAGDSCCCPREFELPQRLFGHMTKQREQQRL